MNEKLSHLAKAFSEHRKISAQLAEAVKENNDKWTEVENQLIECMVEEGITSVKIEGFGLFILKRENYASVTGENKPRVFNYLKESGNGSLLKEDVSAQTLRAWTKTHVTELADKFRQEGRSDAEKSFEQQAVDYLMEKGFSIFTRRSISLTGGKNV